MSAPLVLQFSISLTTWLVFFILLEEYGERAKAISNTMRNVFGILGVFVWAFASASNIMVSNLIGQNLQHKVIPAINKIMLLSVSATFVLLTMLNLFPTSFFSLFGQSADFVREAIPVLRVISLAMLCMSISTVWLNAVTGTGKTKMNLLIEMVAVIFYLIYIYIVMIRLKLSLPIAWTNEFVYWIIIFTISFWYMRSGRWRDV
jgi:Na+-driven multidrug efflux pump